MARFSMCSCAIVSRISANAFMIVSLLMLLLIYLWSGAQTLGGCNPDVVALEVDAENIVVGRRGGDRDWRYLALRVAHRHLRLAVFERGAIDGPVDAVIVSQPLIGAEPGAIGVHALERIDEVRGKSAVCRQKVVPVAAIVAAAAEICGGPQDVIHITDRGDNLVDQTLVLEEHNLVFAVGVLVLIPASGLLRVFQKPAAPHSKINLVRRGGNPADPDLDHGRVALVVEHPLAGARVQLAAAGGRGHPHVLAFHRSEEHTSE